jgi:diacylglycerol kinase
MGILMQSCLLGNKNMKIGIFYNLIIVSLSFYLQYSKINWREIIYMIFSVSLNTLILVSLEFSRYG